MDAISDIFRNPSFKKDFAFIQQLEANNKDYQDKIWEKFIGTYKQKKEDDRVVNNRFDSHPCGFSSDSEDTIVNMNEDSKYQPKFQLSTVNIKLKEQNEKHRSASAGKMVLNETKRKKLRKQINKHLKRGTLEEFEITKIGDHPLVEEKEIEKLEEKVEEMEEIYLDHWKKPKSTSASTTPQSSSASSSTDGNIAQTVDCPPPPEVRGKVVVIEPQHMEQIIEETQMTLKPREKVKGRSRIKSPQSNESRRITSASITTECRKSRYYIEKCIGIIKDLGLILNQDIVPPDGSEDYARRQVRTREFTLRFSRVYMYPLVRHLSQLEDMSTQNRSIASYSKFAAIYQLIFQALYASLNHFAATVGTSAYHKLKEHLSCIIQVCDTNTKYYEKDLNYENREYINILRSQCVGLINKIDDNFLSTSVNSLLKSRSTRASLVPASISSKSMGMPPNKKKFHNRFAMYNSNLASRKERHWKRMVESIEGKKSRVKSRYRTATFKHRPPIEKHQSIDMMVISARHRLDDKKSLTLLRNTPVATPMNEDNIETMIQYEKERDYAREDSERGEFEEEDEEITVGKTIVKDKEELDEGGDNDHQQEDILTKLLQLVQDSDQKNESDPDANLTNTIKVLQQCLSFKKQNSKLFEKITAVEKESAQERLTTATSQMVIQDKYVKKHKKDPVITVTGTKNAQLICIKDDNSIASFASDVEETEKPSVPNNSPRKSLFHGESNTSIWKPHGINNRRSMSKIRICRVSRPRATLELLPKEYAINVIQYKLAFSKHHKGNYMYKKTTTINPWEMMDKISEDILDFALLGIAKEIEVNELLENMYNSEFQY